MTILRRRDDMDKFPVRKTIRLSDYDYSTPGAYFITVCTANREKIFWSDRRGELRSPVDRTIDFSRRGELCSPANLPLSDIGMVIDKEIQKLNAVYTAVHVDKYCIMPDHIHMILIIDTDADGRTQFAPTISRVMKQFKGAITKQIGRPIWQKSFYEHAIRNQQDYNEIWEYIENNPLKYLLNQAP